MQKKQKRLEQQRNSEVKERHKNSNPQSTNSEPQALSGGGSIFTAMSSYLENIHE